MYHERKRRASWKRHTPVTPTFLFCPSVALYTLFEVLSFHRLLSPILSLLQDLVMYHILLLREVLNPSVQQSYQLSNCVTGTVLGPEETS